MDNKHAEGVLVLKPGHQRALSIFDAEIRSLNLQKQRYLEALLCEHGLDSGGGTWAYDPTRNALIKQEDTTNGVES